MMAVGHRGGMVFISEKDRKGPGQNMPPEGQGDNSSY
jgi:hypothetical protein